ncbi:MAG: FAD-binding protein, partial [Gammaproteobacteria bacterium]|nr:FAD-binding protein [Gammaproteobacteria bacterium]
MSILVVAEHDNDSVKAPTLIAVAAAQVIGGDIEILIAGFGCSGASEAASKIAGVSKVLVADNEAYAHQLAENIADLINEIGSNYSHILAVTTTSGKNYMPRVAALLDVAQISDISGVVSEDTFERPIYAGNAIATVQSSDSIKVLTVRGTAFDPVEAEGGSASVENLDIVKDTGLSSWDKDEIAKLERPELTAASIIISGGRGMQNGENFALLESVADKLGAAIGASRAAVDAGFVPNDMQ